MKQFLDNPVYHALVSGDAKLGLGNGRIRYFPREVSPFAGFETGYNNGFEDLHRELPPDRNILFATRKSQISPAGWETVQQIAGSQFILEKKPKVSLGSSEIRQLSGQHVDQMVSLARLTKPGPFDERTIEFGHYHGIFDGERLVAMTGQRLHVYEFTEVSAVCTHPDYLGRGYAAALILHQVEVIFASGKTPFLHVRSDNSRAISLYERLGFAFSGPMHFYFMRKR